ncbi:MAG: DUF4292 domain-containing protein [Sphingobacteriales bacterium]|jgi:hypothetical protein|nr:DUF4292 domain-containing protein [Sphingobacteriales bacterium]
MKNIFFFIVIFFASVLSSCRSTRHINEAIGSKDTPIVNSNAADSIRMVQETIATFKSNHIDFKTFSAKIKVESSGNKGKNPDITAVVRMVKDSAIWMSLSATFLNYEAYRVLITKDSVILLNKQDKEVQYRSMDYLQEITEIPFDFHTLQELIIGNPVFFSDSISSFKQLESQYMVSSVGSIFKNLLTLTKDRKLMMHSKMDDVDLSRNRTADITYDDYETNNGIAFSTNRQIVATEKNKIDIRMNFKQYEFNKELSVSFTVPKNYQRK